ncbi:flippase-like domain-containing protein [Candidatus Woesearchaeota archaeon]|nr:flippase-like domain-containing protein [Candidatus Woesearchaeota archaeon]
MKKLLALISSFALGVVLLIWVFRTYPISEVFAVFLGMDLLLLLSFVLVSVILMACLAYRWKLILRSQGHEVRFRNLFLYRITGHAVSFITPSAKLGGEAVRAALLRKNGLSFAKGISSVLIDKIIEISSAGIFFCIGVLVVLAMYTLPDETTVLLSSLALVFIGITAFFFYRILNGHGFFLHIFRALRLDRARALQGIEKRIEEFEAMIIKFYRHDHKDFAIAISLTVLSWILMFVEYRIITLMLGLDADIIGLFMIFSFVGGAYLIPVPMALGVLEAAQVSIFSLMGFSAAGGIALAFLIRGRDLLWTVVGFAVLPLYGIRYRKALASTMDGIGRKEREDF